MKRMNTNDKVLDKTHSSADRRKCLHQCGEVIIIAAIAIQILLILYCCLYSSYTADDYWHTMTARSIQSAGAEAGLLRTAWDFMLYQFAEWQGTYLSMFVQILFCPLSMGLENPNPALHAILAVTWLLFAGVTGLLVHRFMQWLGIQSRWISVGVYALYLTTWINMRTYEENFLWFSGSTSYTMPLILAGAGILLYLRKGNGQYTADKMPWGRIAASAVCLFLACGGSLEIAIAISYVLLVITGMRYYRDRSSVTWRNLIPMAAAYVGTFINGISPGNYLRHDVTAENRSALSSVYHAGLETLFQYFDESSRMFNTTVLPVMLLTAILAGVLLQRRISKRSVQRALVLVLLMQPLPLVQIFPVVLGYGNVGLPQRILLLLYMTMTALWLILGLSAGWYLAGMWENRRQLVVTLALLMLVAAMTDDVALYRTYDVDHVKQLPMSVIAMDMQKGWVVNYYEDVCAFYDRIKAAAGADLTLTPDDVPDAPDGLMPTIVLEQDSLAGYYGLNSLEYLD